MPKLKYFSANWVEAKQNKHFFCIFNYRWWRSYFWYPVNDCSLFIYFWFEVGKYNSHYFIFESTIFDLEFDCFIFNCKYVYSFNYNLLRLSIFLAQSKVPVSRRVWNTVIYFLELRSDRNGAKTWLVRPFSFFFVRGTFFLSNHSKESEQLFMLFFVVVFIARTFV
jgi:hypothetical protein